MFRVSVRFPAAPRIIAGIILLGTMVSPDETLNASVHISKLNIQAQTACEQEILARTGGREVLRGKAYAVLTQVARTYGRAIPHIYTIPGSINMAYISASVAVDGRGKILVGQQAAELFGPIALKGFFGHEMAHLVSDNAALGCDDYILRDPQLEADADALAARTIGKRPVEAFLGRLLVLTKGQNWDAKRRLEVLRQIQLRSSSLR
jgi:hypothetical protein